MTAKIRNCGRDWPGEKDAWGYKVMQDCNDYMHSKGLTLNIAEDDVDEKFITVPTEDHSFVFDETRPDVKGGCGFDAQWCYVYWKPVFNVLSKKKPVSIPKMADSVSAKDGRDLNSVIF